MTVRTEPRRDVPGVPASPDGRYLASDGCWFVELRIDVDGSGVISADLVTVDAGGRQVRACVRTAPGVRVERAAGEWPAVWVAGDATATGTIAVSPQPDRSEHPQARFTLDAPLLPSLPEGRPLTVELTRAGDGLRSIDLQLEVEEGLEWVRDLLLDDSERSLPACLRRAGFAVRVDDDVVVVPRPADEGEWSVPEVFSILNREMNRAGEVPMDIPVWKVHLMLMSRCGRSGLLGVMFDNADERPRQGAAVFIDAIRDRVPPQEVERKIRQVVLHELGHALNLTHRFTREVGRADSCSPMNYDWFYRGGGHAEEFWQHFDFSFDDDELAFLRHGPWNSVVPGGAPFGSARYWVGGDCSTGPRERVRDDVRLWLTPPAGGARYHLGQPVYLQVSLENSSDHDVRVPRHALDVKAGVLEIEILPVPDGVEGAPSGAVPGPESAAPAASSFVPVMRRCYDVAAEETLLLQPGESIHLNVALTFGSAGYPFAEPGRYTVHPVLSVPCVDPTGQLEDSVARGEAVEIEILPAAAGVDPGLLADHDVAMHLALGGASALDGARAKLTALADSGAPKALAASAVRSLGLAAGRVGDHAGAAELLERALAEGAREAFDPHTLETTRLLADRHTALAADGGEPLTAVVVDYAARVAPATADDAAVTVESVVAQSISGRMTGALIADEQGRGWAVVAPAAHLPAGTTQISAMVSVMALDGLYETVRVRRADLFGDAENGYTHVMLWLSRTVPATPTMPVSVSALMKSAGPDADPWEVLVRNGIVPQELAATTGHPLGDTVPGAVDEAGAVTPAAVPQRAATTHVTRVKDVAWGFCDVWPFCEPSQPPFAAPHEPDRPAGHEVPSADGRPLFCIPPTSF